MTEYTHLSTDAGGVTPGENYSFKVLATNAVGESLLSLATTIKAATVPDAPSKPVLVDQQPSYIEFNWNTPYDGYDSIIDYRIQWD